MTQNPFIAPIISVFKVVQVYKSCGGRSESPFDSNRQTHLPSKERAGLILGKVILKFVDLRCQRDLTIVCVRQNTTRIEEQGFGSHETEEIRGVGQETWCSERRGWLCGATIASRDGSNQRRW